MGLRSRAGAYGDSGIGDDNGYEAHSLTKALQDSQDGCYSVWLADGSPHLPMAILCNPKGFGGTEGWVGTEKDPLA